MKTFHGLLALTLLGGQAALAAPAPQAGTSTNTFLRLEQGARPIGMGGAFSAVASGADAVWWNPAGLARSSLREGLLSHTMFIQDITSQYAAFVHPAGKSGWMGYSFTYFSVPGVEGYDSSKNATGELKAYNYAASIGYGLKLSHELSLGANAKYVQQTLDTISGTGIAVDLGAQYRDSSLMAGVVVQNMGPKVTVGTASNKLPTNVRGGVAFNATPSLVLALDAEKPSDAYFSYHIGAELRVAGSLALRGGYHYTQSLGQNAGFSAGVSIYRILGGSGVEEGTGFFDVRPEEMVQQVKGGDGMLASVDYAFVSYGDFSGTNRISLSIRF